MDRRNARSVGACEDEASAGGAEAGGWQWRSGGERNQLDADNARCLVAPPAYNLLYYLTSRILFVQSRLPVSSPRSC